MLYSDIQNWGRRERVSRTRVSIVRKQRAKERYSAVSAGARQFFMLQAQSGSIYEFPSMRVALNSARYSSGRFEGETRGATGVMR